MVVRAIVAAARLALFVGALVAFLLARAFLDGGLLGDTPTDLGRSFALSFFASMGLFLCLVGLWTFRLEETVRRLLLRRLLFARVVFSLILAACVGALVVMALLPVTAVYLTAAGVIVALAGMAATFLQPKRGTTQPTPPRIP